MSGEAASRADLGLPGRQEALARAVLSLGPPVVAILTSGRPLTLPWLFRGGLGGFGDLVSRRRGGNRDSRRADRAL